MSLDKRRFTDYFDLLGVDRDATKESVQKAFMLKANIWHPDRAETDDEREHFTKVYQDLQTAYKILSNEHSRKQYLDAQQTTDLEFKFAERDVGYGTTDQFRNESGGFDQSAFMQAFDQSRDAQEQEAIDALQMGQYGDTVTVNDDDLKSYLERRNAETQQLRQETQQVFTGTGKDFDHDTFNRAFDIMKENNPGTGVQPYEGDPMAMFSGGGLAECDNMAGINFGNGFSYGNNKDMDYLVQGQSSNPTKDLDLKALQTGERYGVEQKLTESEIQAKMAAIQEHRTGLATMDKEQFIVEPSEIEKLYSDLFAPMDVEGLEAPVGVAGPTEPIAQEPAVPRDSGKIRQKIEQRKRDVDTKVKKSHKPLIVKKR